MIGIFVSRAVIAKESPLNPEEVEYFYETTQHFVFDVRSTAKECD